MASELSLQLAQLEDHAQRTAGQAAQRVVDRGAVLAAVGHLAVEGVVLGEGDDDLVAAELDGVGLGEAGGEQPVVGADGVEDGGPQAAHGVEVGLGRRAVAVGAGGLRRSAAGSAGRARRSPRRVGSGARPAGRPARAGAGPCSARRRAARRRAEARAPAAAGSGARRLAAAAVRRARRLHGARRLRGRDGRAAQRGLEALHARHQGAGRGVDLRRGGLHQRRLQARAGVGSVLDRAQGLGQEVEQAHEARSGDAPGLLGEALVAVGGQAQLVRAPRPASGRRAGRARGPRGP